MHPNETIGAEREHLLVGSAAWLDAEERAAAREGKGFGLNGAIARAIRNAEERPAERVTAHEETDTGKQLHHTFINHIEVTHAMERLCSHSDRQHRRYRMFQFDGLTVEEIAEAEDESAATITRSLQLAHQFLRHLILDEIT